MKKPKILVALLCLTLLTSCSAPYFSPNESQVESKTVVLTSESSEDNTSAESNQPFAPYISYQLDLSVEDVLNDNPIDKSFLAEKSNHITTVAQIEYLERYYKIWDTELNFTLEKLRAVLEGSSLKALDDSQSDWIKFHVSDTELGVEVYLATAGQGSIIPILNGYQAIALIRQRTLELKEYCYMVTGDFSFEYH
jgi:uncharacterized protein YecT (DUF1311 family)